MPKHFKPQDHYFAKAKESGFRARSVYKLNEIQDKYKLIKKGDMVLDLGAAPGSFMQLASHIVGQSGLVVGFDLVDIPPFREKNIVTIIGDIFEHKKIETELTKLGIQEFDVVISDLAPNTSGIKNVDQEKSMELSNQALKLTLSYLKKGGNMLMKVFEGGELQSLKSEVNNNFERAKLFKPQATRSRSKEIYLIGFDRK